MSLKDNFNQAMKEILKKDGFVGKNLSEESKKDSSLDSILGREQTSVPQTVGSAAAAETPITEQPASFGEAPASAPAPAAAPAPEYSSETAEAREPSAASAYSSAGPAHSSVNKDGYDPFGSSSDPFGFASRPQEPAPKITPPPQPRAVVPPERTYTDSEETTVISKNIVISGGTVTGFANVQVDGSIQGDIRITKDVSVTGKIVGDIECNNAVMAGSAVQGSVNSKGQLRMDRDSVLLGDVNTQYLDMNGRIKGTVDVSGKAEFKSDSVVIGDITASTITVLDGAVIKGFVNTTFLQDNSNNVFPDAISVSDQ